MKPHMIDDMNPITIIRLLEQSKRACDSNKVSRDMAL